MPRYTVYGLRLDADRPIPGFVAEEGTGSDVVDVRVLFSPEDAALRDDQQWRAHPTLLDRRQADPSVVGVSIQESVETGSLAVTYSDGARFVVSPEADEIAVLPPAGMDMDSVCTYLVNPVLALLLRLRGRTCLHASAVSLDGVATVFMAPSGSGKSTLAYQLGALGGSVMADDVAAITDDPPMVQPGYPRIRLWPWTVEGLLGSAEALPLISSDWEKRRATVEDFDPRPQRLGALCLLDGFADELTLEPMTGPRAVMALMENTYLNYLLADEHRRRDFEVLSRLVEQVPVVRLRRPFGLDTLAGTSAPILQWMATRQVS